MRPQDVEFFYDVEYGLLEVSPEHTEELAVYLGGVESGRLSVRKAETVLWSQPVLDAAVCPACCSGEGPAVLTVIRVPLAECWPGLGAARAHSSSSCGWERGGSAREGLCAVCSVSHVPGSTVAEPGQQNSPAVS